jgi:formylglycine-generating enzyme required for sulfatase activity
MRKLLLLLAALTLTASTWAQTPADSLVLVKGGTFKDTRSNYAGKNITLPDFYIGKYEVSQKEWREVMGNNPAKFQDDARPVESVSWYDCVDYCNRRSLREGLQPCYVIDQVHRDANNQTAIDDVKWTVILNASANGYRLPTETEWEYAARGGQLSQGYTYSGSDDIDRVAWFWQNAGDKPLTGEWRWPVIEENHTKPHAVGGKAPNELGLFDMSGNVREWCWDWFGELTNDGTTPQGSTPESGRVWKGGGWIGGDFCCAPSFRAGMEANGKGPDQGLRVCRNK